MMKKVFLFLFLGLTLFSCKKDEPSYDEQLGKDISEIEKYLNDNGLQAQRTSTGLHYIHTLEGSGTENPNINSRVEVHYKGFYTDKKVFDQTAGSTAKFFLYQVIKGWQEGIPLMKKGGKTTFLIPSGLGYGSNPPGSVRKNAVLIFEVELVSF